MPESRSDPPADSRARPGARAPLLRNERLLLSLIALIAAARVLLLSAVFPLFNNVDEYSHFDAVYRYSRGELPRPERLHHDIQASALIIWLGSPEYVSGPPSAAGAAAPRPPWSVSPEEARARSREGIRRLTAVVNHELAQPPIYYALAGAWYRLAEALGLACGPLVFSIRWLNALWIAGLVFATHRLARASGLGSPLTRIGAPLLIALLPQDVFYSISNDALSPLLAALALLAILRMHSEPARSSLSALAGLLCALAILTKYSNGVVLIPAAALSGLDLCRREPLPRGWLRCRAAFSLALVAPILAWGARNAAVFGDPTVRSMFFETLGWQTRPLGAFLDHPLFSLWGLQHFLDGLCRDFWRGRFKWNGEFMSHPLADAVYIATTALFLAAASVSIARELLRWLGHRRRSLPPGLCAYTGAWLTVAGGVALLAFFSIWIETAEHSVPPRDDPFFTMGRLISGCLAPFALLYLRGLEDATSWISARARGLLRAGLLGLVLLTILASEAWLSAPPARSEYNWFHLRDVEYGPCAATPPWRAGETGTPDS